MSVATIQDWVIKSVLPTPYSAPETATDRLIGHVYGHPRHPDGKKVISSPVVSTVGRVVTTQSGTKYRLGRVCPAYRRWMKAQGITYDPKQPIKAHEPMTAEDAATLNSPGLR